MDRVYDAAAKATSTSGFQNAGEAIESTAAYSAAKQTLDNYTKTACPNLDPGLTALSPGRVSPDRRCGSTSGGHPGPDLGFPLDTGRVGLY